MSSKNVVDLRAKRSKPPESAPARRETPARATASVRRTSALRVKRRKIRLIITFVILILILGAVYAVGFASYMPRYSISSINVVGAQDVPSNIIHDYVQTQLFDVPRPFLSPYNIFLYRRAVLERGIVASFPRIESAQISRPAFFSTALTITVQERQPFALWCQNSQDGTHMCYQMDKNGFVFAEAPTDATSTTNEYVFEGNLVSASSTASTTNSALINPIGRAFVSAHLPGILALLGMLKDAGFHPIGASIVSDQDFSVPLSEGFIIKASFGEDPDSLVRNLQLVLSSDPLQGNQNQIEYIDLRFGDRVYYKLKGQVQAQTPSQ